MATNRRFDGLFEWQIMLHLCSTSPLFWILETDAE